MICENNDDWCDDPDIASGKELDGRVEVNLGPLQEDGTFHFRKLNLFFVHEIIRIQVEMKEDQDREKEHDPSEHYDDGAFLVASIPLPREQIPDDFEFPVPLPVPDEDGVYRLTVEEISELAGDILGGLASDGSGPWDLDLLIESPDAE